MVCNKGKIKIFGSKNVKKWVLSHFSAYRCVHRQVRNHPKIGLGHRTIIVLIGFKKKLDEVFETFLIFFFKDGCKANLAKNSKNSQLQPSVKFYLLTLFPSN